jgi:O-antigen/teichoic acid export membrane protein
MMIRKTESFVRGALLLSLAALVSRLLGAFYKPIIARIFAPFDGIHGAVGIGLTQVPMTAYQVILSFTSVGLNVGISRLVAERLALGDTAGARRVFRLSLIMMTGLGLAASILFWFGAPWIARAISVEVLDAIPGFRAMAPALVIVSIMAAYRGLFQGFQNMAPNAYSQIIEQVVRVGSGILLTYLVLHRTGSVALGAAGFNFGDVIGALAGLVYLLYLVRRTGEGLWSAVPTATAMEQPPEAALPIERPWTLMRRIFTVAGPITLVGAVVPLMMLADTFFVFRALGSLAMEGDMIRAQYGMLTNVFMIVHLPAVFTTAIYTSILPAITQAAAQGLMGEVRRKANQAYRLTLLLAIPAQAGLYTLATGLYYLIYNDVAGGSVMAAISFATVPIMLQQTTSGVLQGAGHIGLPVRNFIFGALVKVVLTAWWTIMWGISGAAYATAVGFLLAAMLNLYHVERLLGRTLQTRAMIWKPLGAALAMVGAIQGLAALLGDRIASLSLQTFMLIILGTVVYAVVLLLVGGLKRGEIEALPRVGAPLASLLARSRFLR